MNVLLLLLGRFKNLQSQASQHHGQTSYPVMVRVTEETTNLERTQQALVNAHHGTGIVEFATVVGSTEQGDQLALGEELVTVFHDLVRTANEVHVVLLQEARHNVGTKGEGDTSVVFAPPGDVLIRIGPEQVAQ